MNRHVRLLFPQRGDHAEQIIVGSQRRMHDPRTQPRQEDMLRRRLADDLREVLMLFVITMKQSQLLLPMRGIIGGINIQDDLVRQ